MNDTQDLQSVWPDPSYIGVECKNSEAGNIYGTCQYTSMCGFQGGTVGSHADCPGPEHIQCCVYDRCAADGGTGTCVDSRNFKCQGSGRYDQ